MSFGYSPGAAGKAPSFRAGRMSKPAAPDCLQPGLEPGADVEPAEQCGLLLAWSGTVWTAGSALMNGSEWLYLPGTPWSLRLAGGSGGRPALEVYAAGSLIDVMVASSRASQLLHGACRAAVGRQARAIAWGCLPTARGELPSVEFISGRIRRRARPAEAESVVGWFWFAEADERFSRVVVTSQGERESCRIPTVDRC
jgi:hypothetical protein